MPTSAKLCPFCRGLNSAGERRCYRCHRPLPGPLATGAIGFVQNALGGDAPMTRLLLGLCIAVFALCVASDRRLPLWISDHFALSTTLRFGALLGGLGAVQPWRYLASLFVHFNVLHLAMNGWSLRAVGPSAERQFGRARFVVLFLLSGTLGFMLSDWWYGVSPPTAGASGAIFGTFGSVIGVAYARRDPNWKQILLQNAVNLAILGFAFPVNNAAHLGGLVTGAALGFLFTKESRRLRLDVPLGLLAGLLLALSLVSVVLSAVSPVWRSLRLQEMSQEP
jgi:membrane associated rhomboid family serine protease